MADHPLKKGRRDRIIETLGCAGVFRKLSSGTEIGAGTSMYLEGVIELAQPKRYEVYETDPGWARYLHLEYGNATKTQLVCPPADGYALRYTPAIQATSFTRSAW
jgi:hypothetical protein